EDDGTKGPMIIEAEIGCHFIHRIYVDGGSASKILYEYCFNRLRPKVKNQMVSATAPLIGFSGEIIWPMGQILLPAESRHVKGAPECMRIFEFMHGITNPELIKRLHDNIPKSVDEMMRVATTFLRGEVAASNQVRKKTLPAWKQQEARRKQNFERRRDFRNQQRSERRHDKFTLLTKSPKEVLALDKGKFKTPPPMTTPVEKRNNNKFCEFHGEVGHNTDECMN
nr:reverse transcriptase domain-containing protein [Tanacetum cinerariifolium]